MTDFNHAILIGRLTRDAELKYTTSGQPVCKFALAVNRSVKRGDKYEDEASFFDVVLWGRLGESIKHHLVKGKQIAIDGELRQDRWEQDGQNRSKVEIVANNVQLLGGGPQNASQPQNGQSHQAQAQNRTATVSATPETQSDDFADDIPF